MRTCDRIRLKREALGIRPSHLSKSIGKKPGYISDLENEGKEPGSSTLAQIAVALDTDPNSLLGFASELEIDGKLADEVSAFAKDILLTGPSTDAILSWWRHTRGDVSKLGRLTNYVAVFECPNPYDKMVKARIVGRNSLANQFFGTPESKLTTEEATNRVNYVIQNGFDENFNKKLVIDYLAPQGSEVPNYSFQDLDLASPVLDRSVRVGYDRWCLPAHGPMGEKLTLIYCRFVQ